MNKKMMVVIGAVTILGAGTLLSTVASAQSTNPRSSLIQKISEKFGLNQDEVQKVFDEQHDQMRKELEIRQNERLDKLVSEGKITQAQKILIINKRKELQDKRASEKEAFRDLTPEERKAKADTTKSELQQWAKENDIDIKYLMADFVIKIKGDGHMMRP